MYYKTEREPVTLYRAVLVARGLDADVATIEADVARIMDEAVQFAREGPEPTMQDMIDCMFSNPINYPPRFEGLTEDRKSVVEGTSVPVRGDLGGGRRIKKKKNKANKNKQ